MNNDFVIYLEAEGYSKNTIVSYTNAVNGLLEYTGKTDVEINPMDIIRWKKMMMEKYAGATVNLKVNGVKTYYKFLQLSGEIKTSPADDVRLIKVENKEKHFMSAEMISDMVNATNSVKMKAIILTFATTGLRVSELTTITLQQYEDMKAKGVNWIEVTGKRNKTRKVFFNDELFRAIDKYIETSRSKNGDKFLFLSNWGGIIHRNSLSESLKIIARRAGVPFWEDICNHALRSAAASIYSEMGVPVADIRDLLGHASIQTTNRYIKANEHRVSNAVNSMAFMR